MPGDSFSQKAGLAAALQCANCGQAVASGEIHTCSPTQGDNNATEASGSDAGAPG